MRFVNPGVVTYGIPVGGIAPLWPVGEAVVSTPVFLSHGGYLAERQSRFYLRGLRRDGLFFEDVPRFALWVDDGWDAGDLW